MTARRLLVSLSLGALAAAASAPAALAFDLTGTWQGRWSCQGYDGGSFRSVEKSSMMTVSQEQNALLVHIDEFQYRGGAIPDTKKPDTKGGAALIQCGTDNIPLAGPESEILRGSVKVNPQKGSGSFKGVSVIEYGPDGDVPGGVITCRYSYKRVDTADPAVPDCVL